MKTSAQHIVPEFNTQPLELSDITPFPAFARQCETQGIATKTQLQWWLRFRSENGLSQSGAIVEKRPNPRSKRPMLFVNKPRFASWLATSQTV